MKTFALAAATALLLIAPAAAEIDGQGHPLQDALLDNMVGKWKATGTIAGKPTTETIEAHWILNHQFLQIHETSAETKDGVPEYEAMPTIGYDNLSERYVLHWLDVFGGRFSETLGYGGLAPDGFSIGFRFEYPDGPFVTTFTWDAGDKQWHWTMVQKNDKGEWQPFADLTLTRK